jgi:4-carboxymuconolactone decarboxylase
MSRVPPLDPATLTAEQQRVAAAISGARKNVRGPFTIWLRNPTLAEHANAFGVALRDSSKLDRRLFELAVITVCRAWSVQYACPLTLRQRRRRASRPTWSRRSATTAGLT